MVWGPKPKSVWARGEQAAARYMRKQGCRVIARNLRLPIGEIDLSRFPGEGFGFRE